MSPSILSPHFYTANTEHANLYPVYIILNGWQPEMLCIQYRGKFSSRPVFVYFPARSNNVIPGFVYICYLFIWIPYTILQLNKYSKLLSTKKTKQSNKKDQISTPQKSAKKNPKNKNHLSFYFLFPRL